MTWEQAVRDKLIELRGNRPVRELARETGLDQFTLYKILSGDRGIGADTLEKLRLTRPELVADVFLRPDSTIGDGQNTTVESPILEETT